MTLQIWYDKEGDFMEILFSDRPGYMRETDNDAIMERVDEGGNLLGFSVLGVSNLATKKP
jgi:hypothetical protein